MLKISKKISLGFILIPLISFNLETTKLNNQNDIVFVRNKNGPTLGYSLSSGVKIITIDGNNFKDLSKNGKLDKYEDWRLSIDERAKDLASKMSIEQIAGLMLYSKHQSIPMGESGFYAGTYNGKIFSKSNAKAYDLTDQQKKFLKDDNLRHILMTKVKTPEIAATWNNNIQTFTEALEFGIPVNNSSDPRNNASSTSAEFSIGSEGEISIWPDGLAMGATFDPELVRKFGNIAAQEYRALGISTALSPQIDLGTEPRWHRIAYVFSESPELTTNMARAYIDGFQTTIQKDPTKNGWGNKSVNAMVKHWPGGGPEEGGRDAHWEMGKYAVYPGNNLKSHIKPFIEGAFKLEQGTKEASALMPYYTISYNQDNKYKENVGNSFSKYIITDLLRQKYAYDGVICTDWLITSDKGETPVTFAGKPWGVEKLSIAKRHYKAIQAGVDQFGGNNDKGPVLEAYEMGVKEHGEKYMRKRFEQSAIRLLKNIFRTGLFENPYVNPKESKNIVGNSKFLKEGYEAQIKSIVMLKNKNNILPLKQRKTVYIPKRYSAGTFDWWGSYTDATFDYPVDLNLLKKYYNLTTIPEKADFALIFVKSPHSQSGGYSDINKTDGFNGYLPVTLQYNTYTATNAREKSIASDENDTEKTQKNRTYKNKTVTASNFTDLLTIENTYQAMKGKPVIVAIIASKPTVFSEFEKYADAILINFNVSNQAILDIISGKYEPSGLLPLQMPKDMKTVELQKEDIPFDMNPYIDTQGNSYDFAYGMNWSGVIKDKRTLKYKK